MGQPGQRLRVQPRDRSVPSLQVELTGMDMAATASKMRMTGMANLSAPARARITGVVYLLFFVTAIAGAIVMPVAGGPGGPSGDAASIGNSIVSHQSAYEAGVALGLFSTAFYVALSGHLYWLIQPWARRLPCSRLCSASCVALAEHL